LQAYNIFVKRKEREIKGVIDAINESNANEQIKDRRIRNLEIKCKSLQNEAFQTERVIYGLREEIKQLQATIKFE